MEKKITFESILEKANDTTLQGKPVQVLAHLDDADLVQLYDLAPDMSYLTDPMDSAGKSIADTIFWAAGVNLEEVTEDTFDDALEAAVEKLRGEGTMKQYRVKPEYLDNWLAHGDSADELIVTEAEIQRLAREWDMSVEELMDQVEEVENEEIVLKISRIAIKSETFCTPWNGHLYCVDITEDAEDRGAWLYRSDMGVKSFMFGYMLKDMDADKFKDLVFSNLPDYIEDYEEEYGA